MNQAKSQQRNGLRDQLMILKGVVPVDKIVLIEYVSMREEIKDLRQRIEKHRRELIKLNEMTVTDSVTCGKKGKKPIRTVKIEGRPVSAIAQKEKTLQRNIERLENLEVELLELADRAEKYIQSIKKSELRMMFRLYYIDDLSYVRVAAEMNKKFPNREIKYTDENIKKRIQRFFQNVPQCPEKIC